MCHHILHEQIPELKSANMGWQNVHCTVFQENRSFIKNKDWGMDGQPDNTDTIFNISTLCTSLF
jgi:hypothetical protein